MTENCYFLRDTAVIVAGGKGTRLHKVTGDLIPKCLVKIAGISVLERQIRELYAFGVRRYFVLAGHLGEQIQPALECVQRELDLEINVFVERKALGTAGCLTYLKGRIQRSSFVIVYGDMIFALDLPTLWSFHATKLSSLTIVCRPTPRFHRSDVVILDRETHRITNVLSRDRDPNLFPLNNVPSSFYICSENFLDLVPDEVQSDFVKDILPLAIQRRLPVFAYRTSEYLRDMGTLDGLEESEQLSQTCNIQASRHRTRPAVFLDRDGVLNQLEPGRGVTNASSLRIYEGIGHSIKKLNDAGYLVFIVTNQPGIAKGFLDWAEMDQIHGRIEKAIAIEGGKVDGIYVCPHHPDSGFDGEKLEFKFACSCRKPEIGLVEMAFQAFAIDRSRSYFIGDTYRDELCAKRSGLNFIGVRTGVGCKDCVQGSPELVISDNVNDAIDLILSNKLISDSIVDEIKKRRATQSSRILVGISGNSRSGKSSFCHSMEQRLRAEGLTSLTIHLDDLIIPKQEREHPDNLIDRLQVRRYAEIVLACRRGKSYSIRSYCGLTGQKLVAPRVYDPGAHDVILIEGVLANHETVASLFDLRIHLSQREDVLRQRFEAYYAWRGYPPEEIEFLFGSRKESEWPVVLQQTQHVDFHFQL